MVVSVSAETPAPLSVFSCFLSILQCVGSFRAYECIDSSGSVYLTKSGASYTHSHRGRAESQSVDVMKPALQLHLHKFRRVLQRGGRFFHLCVRR